MENIKVIARNKKANLDYFILDTLECGIVLLGTEIKAIKTTKTSIQDAHCQIKKNELWIIDMHIGKYEHGNIFNHDVLRNRKLLAHRHEIRKLQSKVSLDGLTLIPLELYLKDGKAKIKLAIAKGKKNYDKRDDLKRKTINSEIAKSQKMRNWK